MKNYEIKEFGFTNLDNGTYIKSFYSIMLNPSAVKISVFNTTNKRIHHKINYNKVCPKILREEIKNG